MFHQAQTLFPTDVFPQTDILSIFSNISINDVCMRPGLTVRLKIKNGAGTDIICDIVRDKKKQHEINIKYFVI